jgi:hypothetical protein
LAWALYGSLVLVDEAAEDRSAFDSLAGGVGDRMVGPGRVEQEAAMGALSGFAVIPRTCT